MYKRQAQQSPFVQTVLQITGIRNIYKGPECHRIHAGINLSLIHISLANVFIILFFVILIIATLASMIYSRYVDVYKRQDLRKAADRKADGGL